MICSLLEFDVLDPSVADYFICKILDIILDLILKWEDFYVVLTRDLW